MSSGGSAGRKLSDRLVDFWGEVQKQSRGPDAGLRTAERGIPAPRRRRVQRRRRKRSRMCFPGSNRGSLLLCELLALFQKSTHLYFYNAEYNTKQLHSYKQENNRISNADLIEYVANSTKTIMSLFNSIVHQLYNKLDTAIKHLYSRQCCHYSLQFSWRFVHIWCHRIDDITEYQGSHIKPQLSMESM